MGLFIERKLRRVSRELVAAREELRVSDEQAAHFAEIADETRIRSLVSDSPLDREDDAEAQGVSGAMSRHRDELVKRIDKLEGIQDDLLDQLSAKNR